MARSPRGLASGGYTTDFVGSQFNGPGSLGDHDHEGHPGWRIDQIHANIVSWLNTHQPQTVLLHIGTNDIPQNYNVSTAPNRLSAPPRSGSGTRDPFRRMRLDRIAIS
jgi:hypothetical protein